MRQRAFSLIELMIVVVIISILATIGANVYARELSRGRDQKRIADIRSIQIALERYRAEHGEYPRAVGIGTVAGEAIGCDTSVGILNDGPVCHGTAVSGTVGSDWVAGSALRPLVDEGYLKELPVDPVNNAQYYYGLEHTCGSDNDPLCGRTTLKCAGNTCCAYELAVHLENGNAFRACERGVELEEEY